jgi:transcriptional regulator with XRE-family HTH domain
MNLSKQIQYYRKVRGYSQETLSKKLYVSRQTISNWETGNSYPDLENLLLLSTLFDVSLDELVKGDVLMMKRELHRKHYYFWSSLVVVSYPIMILMMAAAVVFWDATTTVLVYAFVIVILVLASVQLEKLKRAEHLKTYAEIVKFMQNQDGKTPRIMKMSRWQFPNKISVSIISGLVTAVLLLLCVWLFRLVK